MNFKFQFFTISCALLIGTAWSLTCYVCEDRRDNGECYGQHWFTISDCYTACVTWQAKLKSQQPTNQWMGDLGGYGDPNYQPPPPIYANYTRYYRGCSLKGCDNIKRKLAEQFQVKEFECQECRTDECNTRANYPSHSYPNLNG